MGFSLGLVLEGVILDTVGWRFGFELCGGLTLALSLVSIWVLPRDKVARGSAIEKLRAEIDWIGAAIGCTFLALSSYVLT